MGILRKKKSQSTSEQQTYNFMASQATSEDEVWQAPTERLAQPFDYSNERVQNSSPQRAPRFRKNPYGKPKTRADYWARRYTEIHKKYEMQLSDRVPGSTVLYTEKDRLGKVDGTLTTKELHKVAQINKANSADFWTALDLLAEYSGFVKPVVFNKNRFAKSTAPVAGVISLGIVSRTKNMVHGKWGHHHSQAIRNIIQPYYEALVTPNIEECSSEITATNRNIQPVLDEIATKIGTPREGGALAAILAQVNARACVAQATDHFTLHRM